MGDASSPSIADFVRATLNHACFTRDNALIDSLLSALREEGAPLDARTAGRVAVAAVARHASRQPSADSLRCLGNALRTALCTLSDAGGEIGRDLAGAVAPKLDLLVRVPAFSRDIVSR